MAKFSKASATQHEEAEGFEGHYAEAHGYTIGFENYTEDVDLTPLFKGLPNDRCQSPHWGIVLKGRLIYHYGNGSKDVIDAGEAYYTPPDHTPELTAGTEVVEFSPSDDFAKTVEVVMKNAQAAEASA